MVETPEIVTDLPDRTSLKGKAVRDKVYDYNAEEGKYGGSIIDSHGSSFEREKKLPPGAKHFSFKAKDDSRCDMGTAFFAGLSVVSVATLALHLATPKDE